jgi:hypothetical protein
VVRVATGPDVAGHDGKPLVGVLSVELAAVALEAPEDAGVELPTGTREIARRHEKQAHGAAGLA